MKSMFLVCATAQLTFLLYMLLAGAGLRLALRVVGVAFAMSLALSTLLTLVIPIAIVAGAQSFAYVTMIVTLFSLPIATLSMARELTLPRVDAVEVVMVNPIVLLFGAPFWLAREIVNPLSILLPGDGVPTVIAGLWPTALAMALAWRGPPGDARIRLVLVLWMQLVAVVWLMPTAVDSVMHFDPSTPVTYLKSVVACLCVAHVLLTLLNLRDVFFGQPSKADRIPLTRRMADGLTVSRWPPVVYLTGALATALAGWYLRSNWPNNGTVVTSLYFAAILVGTLARGGNFSTDVEHKPPKPIVWRSYRGSLVLAVIGLLLILVVRSLRDSVEYVGPEGAPVSMILAGIWVVGAAFVVWPALIFSGIVADSVGSMWSDRSRHATFLASLLVLVLWQALVFPREHPRGGLDDSEISFGGVRAYIWYAKEFGPLYHSGRVVFIQEGMHRRRFRECGESPWNPVQSIESAGLEIVCRWPDHVILRAATGLSVVQADDVTVAPLGVRALGPHDVTSACSAVVAPQPVLRCADGDWPLSDLGHAWGSSAPTSWQPERAIWRELRFPAQNVVCAEIPAFGVMPDGRRGAEVVVLIFPPGASSGTDYRWVADIDGRCTRLGEITMSEKKRNGHLSYEWSPLTGPFRHRSRDILTDAPPPEARSRQEQSAQP